jgi:hypothetical protein
LSEGLKKEGLKKEKTEVIIQFHDQKMDLSSYRSSWDKSQKGSFIFKALQENTRISQNAVQKWLTDKGISFKSNMLVNALLVTSQKSKLPIWQKDLTLPLYMIIQKFLKLHTSVLWKINL